MNKADKYFLENLRKIKEEGVNDLSGKVRPRYKSDGAPAHTKYITFVTEEYDIDGGEFPISTLRKLAFKGGVNEALAIYQSQTNTQEGFESHSVHWWSPWMNKEGNIGKSYAYNLESHRDNDVKREVIKVQSKKIDYRLGEPKKIKRVFDLENPIDNTVHFDKYVTVEDTGKRDSKNRKYYAVQFLNTGYKTELRKDQIGKSLPHDPYERTTYGIGYLGNYKNIKNISEKHVKILKDKWENMFRRCYSDKYEHRDNYKEVFVHQEWHSLEEFLKSVFYIPQFHLAKEDDFKGWDLDKDYFQSNCYSKETCVFLKSRENKSYSSSKPFIYDGKTYLSQVVFAEEHDISQSHTSQLIKRGIFKGKEIKFAEIEEGYSYRYELSKNQVNELIKNLKENPFSRRHMLSFFNWTNQDKKMLVECAFQSLISVREIEGVKYLDWALMQRSSDYLVAGHINMAQYVAMQLAIAHEVGMKPGKFVRFTSNLHVYDRHMDQLDKILNRVPSKKSPKIVLSAKGKNFYEITIEDFELVDFECDYPQLDFELGI